MILDFGNPTKIESFVDAVQKYADKEFQSPFRSTVPMLSLLHHAPKHFASIVGEIGRKSIDKVILEYQVPPKLGRGQASHTDALLLKKGLDSTADVVVEKLMGLKPIFKFGQEKITWIG